MKTKCQQEFEKWARNAGAYQNLNLYSEDGIYGEPRTIDACNAWCAAWEAAQRREYGDIRTVRIKEDGTIINPRIKNDDK